MSNSKFFPNDISMFAAVNDTTVTANEVNQYEKQKFGDFSGKLASISILINKPKKPSSGVNFMQEVTLQYVLMTSQLIRV